MRLLIVEDSPVLRDGLHDILAFEGFEVLPASNGREALALMEVSPPDLILSDITMPEMDGVAFYQAVHANEAWITIPFIFLTARGEKEDILLGKKLGVDDYLVKPITRDELVTTVRSRLERSRQVRALQLNQAVEMTLTMLANTIEGRDLYTRGHVERVRDYSLATAAQFSWEMQALETLRFGAILHDIGKIFVPEPILNKAGRLTAEEWEVIKQHPLKGKEMAKGIPYLAPSIPIILHHHEHWDGSGYPGRLAGEKIPLAARITAVADAFDAMTYLGRPYYPLRAPEEAYQEIIRCAGTQFDPQVVAAFRHAWIAGEIQAIWESWFASQKENAAGDVLG